MYYFAAGSTLAFSITFFLLLCRDLKVYAKARRFFKKLKRKYNFSIADIAFVLGIFAVYTIIIVKEK